MTKQIKETKETKETTLDPAQELEKWRDQANEKAGALFNILILAEMIENQEETDLDTIQTSALAKAIQALADQALMN